MPADREAIRQAMRRPAVVPTYPGAKTAAVAAILTPSDELLFIRRADYPKDPWSGHLSFPGGRVEEADEHALAAAIRETEEEIGLRLSPEQVLGELDGIPTLRGLPALVIRSYLFGLDEDPVLTPNVEVASVHRLGLDALLAGTGRGLMTRTYEGQEWTLPCVDFDNVRLWGLTLAIVDDLLHRIDSRGTGLMRVQAR